MILAADHVRDLHLDIIHDIDEMKNPRAVRAADGHVGIRLRAGHVKLDAPADDVIHDNSLAREFETHRAAVLVNASRVLEFFQIAPINRLALALNIWPEIAADLP